MTNRHPYSCCFKMLILRKTTLQLFIFWKASLWLVKAVVNHSFADS